MKHFYMVLLKYFHLLLVSVNAYETVGKQVNLFLHAFTILLFCICLYVCVCILLQWEQYHLTFCTKSHMINVKFAYLIISDQEIAQNLNISLYIIMIPNFKCL